MGTRLLDRALTGLAVLGGLCLLGALAGPALGLHVLYLRSGSMAPTIPTGSVALTHAIPVEEVRVGEVVTVRSGGADSVTHRVVARSGTELTLRGDANDAADPMTYRPDRVQRVVAHAPWAGYVLGWLTGPVGLLLLGGLALGLLVLVLRPEALAAAAVVAIVPALALGAGSLRPAWAAPWTDSVAISGSAYTSATVGTPTLTCATALGSVRFDWTPVSGATGYRLHYGIGGATTEVVAAATITRTIALVGSGTFWVEALHDFGAVTWESGSSNRKAYSITALVLASCTNA